MIVKLFYVFSMVLSLCMYKMIGLIVISVTISVLSTILYFAIFSVLFETDEVIVVS
jgi:hypothetical protein